MWAWATDMVDVVARTGWKLIEDETLRFYRAHGVRSVASLERWIIDRDLVRIQIRPFAIRYEGPPF